MIDRYYGYSKSRTEKRGDNIKIPDQHERSIDSRNQTPWLRLLDQGDPEIIECSLFKETEIKDLTLCVFK